MTGIRHVQFAIDLFAIAKKNNQSDDNDDRIE